MLEVTPDVHIAEAEVTFTASRSSGPGGQNVNKVNTRVTLQFDVQGSPSLTDEQKQRIRSRLGNRINKEGILQVTAQGSRSQSANMEAARRRFIELLRNALRQPKRRKKTRVPPAVKRKRLESKRKRSEVKRLRSSRDV